MKNPLAIMALCVAAVATPAHAQYAAEQLSANWTPVAAQLGGKEFPLAAFQGAQLVLTESAYRFGSDSGTYRVLPEPASGRMEIRGETGPNAGKTIAALYRLEGNELLISYQLGQGEPPADFSSPAGSTILLIRYRRTP